MSEDRDFDFEPLPGLPAPLPDGERLIWRGSPDPWRLAARAFRLPMVGAYFVALGGWQLGAAVHEGATLAQMADRVSWTAGLGVAAIAILAGLGYAIAKNTFYTVTTRRVIVRHGVAMPMAINVPFSKIDHAGLKAYADATGDIPFTLAPGNKIPRLLLWPHTQPFSYRTATPMLRAVPNAARVAGLVGEAMAAAAGQATTTPATRDATTMIMASPAVAMSRDHDRHGIGTNAIGAT